MQAEDWRTPKWKSPARWAPAAISGWKVRSATVIADQSISSLTNLLLSLVVLRSVGSEGFGAFTLALTVYFFALAVGRGLCGEPQIVRVASNRGEDWRRSTQGMTGLALMLGVATGSVLLAASVLFRGPVGAAFVPLAVTLPGLLLQDAWRYAFFGAGMPGKALANDSVWGILQFIFVVWILLGRSAQVPSFLWAWGTAGTAAALVGIVQVRFAPSLTASMSWLVLHKELGFRFVAEVGFGLGAAQVMLIGIAAVSSLATLGTLNAARVLLGPFNVILLGAIGFAVPEGIRLMNRSPQRVAPVMRRLGALLALVAIGCGVVVFVLPNSVGIRLLGPVWPEARRLIPLIAVFLAATGASEGARVGLRVLSAARRSLHARMLIAPLLLVGGISGAAAGSAMGAASGIAIAHSIGAVIWWRQFEAENRLRLSALSVPSVPSS